LLWDGNLSANFFGRNGDSKKSVPVLLLQGAVEGVLEDDDVVLQLLRLGVATQVPPVLDQLTAVQEPLLLFLPQFQLEKKSLRSEFTICITMDNKEKTKYK
jgi:hypothetical protein